MIRAVKPRATAAKRLLRIGLLGALALLCAPVMAQQRPSAPAQSGDPATSAFDDVDECDLLASHPNDPERIAEGVADDAIVPRLAIRACEAAIRRSPNEARFVFQLGRALLAADRRQDAAKLFERAAQSDYGAGLAYLGDAYQFGHGVPADSSRAMAAYRKAVERGFKPAEGQIEMLTFDPARFITPIPGLLFQGEMAALTDPTQQPLNVYLYGFVTTLAQDCQALLPAAVMLQVLVRRYPQGWTPDADINVDVMRTGPAGEFDAKAFVRRHGCDGPIAREMGARVTRLFLLQ